MSDAARYSYIRVPSSCELAVTRADLDRLDVLRQLLLTFNDPSASARSLAPFVERFPALRARVASAFARAVPFKELPDVTQQIAMVGNRALEGVLLELMEDLAAIDEPEAPTEPLLERRSA